MTKQLFGRRLRAQDRDLWPVGALLWLASLAHVCLTIVGREAFGAEATAALLCVLFVPYLLLAKPKPTSAEEEERKRGRTA